MHIHNYPQASRVQPSSQTGSQFGGLVSDTIQQQLGYSQQQSGVQYLPLQHANPWQQHPPSGQLTGEFQGIYMHYARQKQSVSLHTIITRLYSDLFWFGIQVFEMLAFGIHCFH